MAIVATVCFNLLLTSGGRQLGFQVADIVRRGIFNNLVIIEVLDAVIIEPVRFRMNAAGASVVANHEILELTTGDKLMVRVSKKFSIGDAMSRESVSQALSGQKWTLLPISNSGAISE